MTKRDRVKDLSDFLVEVATLLETILQCRSVLFRKAFRERVSLVTEEAMVELKELSRTLKRRRKDEELVRRLREAGLVDDQLAIKLESFEFSLLHFEAEGGETNLQDVLDRAHIILNSLAAAIPIVGPLAKELVDFFNKELRRRFRNSGIF